MLVWFLDRFYMFNSIFFLLCIWSPKVKFCWVILNFWERDINHAKGCLNVTLEFSGGVAGSRDTHILKTLVLLLCRSGRTFQTFLRAASSASFLRSSVTDVPVSSFSILTFCLGESDTAFFLSREKKITIYIVCGDTHACLLWECVAVRGQLLGIGFLLLSREFQGWNWGHQATLLALTSFL